MRPHEFILPVTPTRLYVFDGERSLTWALTLEPAVVLECRELTVSLQHGWMWPKKKTTTKIMNSWDLLFIRHC